MLWLANRLATDDPVLGAELGESRGLIGMIKADAVLVTVNDTETEQLRAEIERRGYQGRVEWGPVNTYRIYGPISGTTIAHVRCTMGSGGQGGSTLTVIDAIRDIQPKCVIGVGVAFGIDEEKQQIGQVLLSQKITAYELQRVGTGPDGELVVTPKGPSAETSPRLLGRFRDGLHGEPDMSILSGEMLSGEKVVDNRQFKHALRTMFPEAVGGEMEGAGVQAASGRSGVEWIVVKAVCDYAENKEWDRDERQRTAATKAAQAVLNVVEHGGLR
jgi:nucleoside phosphorylase